MIRILLGAWVLVVLAAGARAAEPAPSAIDKPVPSQDELDKQFAETMSGATLVGNFTVTGRPSDAPLKEERYTLGKVAKLKNGLWSIEARIQYGDHNVKLPITLPVKWAGDTAVITVTDVAFPPLGTYTARVLIYRGQYAGTWSGGDHGGHLFGKVVKAGDDAGGAKPATEK